MDRRKAFLKGAAVVSALVLVGSFVAYRAGAFTKPPEPLPQPEPEATVAPQQPPPGAIEGTSNEDLIFLAGSKSSDIVRPPKPTPPQPAPATPTPQPPSVFMGGSKWGAIVPTTPTPNPPVIPVPPQP